MRLPPTTLFLLALLTPPAQARPYGLVLHGGAGVILRAEMSAEVEAAYRAKLQEALDAGYTVLDQGGPAMEAVIAAVRVMEDSPLFNAGHGAVLTNEGTCELDASVMDGRTRGAGAVAGVKRIRNPILLARDVMTRSEHVMLSGEGAERFAQTLGYDLVPNTYFQTERRRRQLEKAKELERKEADTPRVLQGQQERVSFLSLDDNVDYAFDRHLLQERKWGTVGCAALDKDGNLAAGTSTGGMTNKKWGRIGDAPIIGAGTYADNASCAVSATGHGEYFIRTVVGHDIAARMRYAGETLAQAAAATIRSVGDLGGTGGVVAIDREGNVALPFNTPGMYRGFRMSSGATEVSIFGD
jgi:L-asparaginase / beta-aspartyl-peptidase